METNNKPCSKCGKGFHSLCVIYDKESLELEAELCNDCLLAYNIDHSKTGMVQVMTEQAFESLIPKHQ